MDDQSAGVVKVRLDGGCVLIRVAGEFDQGLHDLFVQAVELGGGDVVVDLSDTTFLDSFGLRALVVGQRDALRRGSRLSIDRASDVARTSLEITGLAEPMGLSAEHDGSPTPVA